LDYTKGLVMSICHSSPGVLMLLTQGPHFGNHCSGKGGSSVFLWPAPTPLLLYHTHPLQTKIYLSVPLPYCDIG
jgi:hypothetical protein